MTLLGRLRHRLLAISPEQVRATRRGFAVRSPDVANHLERIGRTFVQGFNLSLEETRPLPLARCLDEVEPSHRGWAYEGAAMGLMLLDRVLPSRTDRWRGLRDEAGGAHLYMLYVGAGWALARLRRPVSGPLPGRDPHLGWLAVDGYGFHEGFFHWKRYLDRRDLPRRVNGEARRIFDQGLGRSVWFVEGAIAEQVATRIEHLHRTRHEDLWSGAGLAACYAGGCTEGDLKRLRDRAGPHTAALAQGAVFGAKARHRAGNETEDTRLACELLCGSTVAAAASLADEALMAVSAEDPLAYQRWRENIRRHF